MNNRTITIALLPLLVLGMGAKGLRVPRGHRNDPPKTAADQERENAARRQNQEQKSQPPPPRPTTSPTSTRLSQAQAKLEQIERRLWAGFEKGDDYVKAAGTLKDAQDGYDTAYKSVVTKLGDQPEYAAAVAKQKEAEAALEAGRKSAQGDVAALAAAAMDARKAVHKLESDAAEQDAQVKDAREKITQAKGAIDELRKGFSETVKGDPDYLAAKKAVDDARAEMGRKT